MSFHSKYKEDFIPRALLPKRLKTDLNDTRPEPLISIQASISVPFVKEIITEEDEKAAGLTWCMMIPPASAPVASTSAAARSLQSAPITFARALSVDSEPGAPSIIFTDPEESNTEEMDLTSSYDSEPSTSAAAALRLAASKPAASTSAESKSLRSKTFKSAAASASTSAESTSTVAAASTSAAADTTTIAVVRPYMSVQETPAVKGPSIILATSPRCTVVLENSDLTTSHGRQTAFISTVGALAYVTSLDASAGIISRKESPDIITMARGQIEDLIALTGPGPLTTELTGPYHTLSFEPLDPVSPEEEEKAKEAATEAVAYAKSLRQKQNQKSKNT